MLNSTTYPGSDACPSTQDCFDPSLQSNQTFLEVYNCNIEKPPRKELQPAEKTVSHITIICRNIWCTSTLTHSCNNSTKSYFILYIV